jgi:spermidine synthase
MFNEVSAPLLDVVKESADFLPAYFPLISIAYDLYPYDPDASQQLFLDLERANPIRREAPVLLRRLFAQ